MSQGNKSTNDKPKKEKQDFLVEIDRKRNLLLWLETFLIKLDTRTSNPKDFNNLASSLYNSRITNHQKSSFAKDIKYSKMLETSKSNFGDSFLAKFYNKLKDSSSNIKEIYSILIDEVSQKIDRLTNSFEYLMIRL